MHAEALGTDLSQAWWDVDYEDLQQFKAQLLASGKCTAEEAASPSWKMIRKHCKCYVKEKQEHARCLEDVKKRWEHSLDWSGRRKWTDGAAKALDGVIKEVRAGLYEGDLAHSQQRS